VGHGNRSRIGPISLASPIVGDRRVHGKAETHQSGRRWIASAIADLTSSPWNPPAEQLREEGVGRGIALHRGPVQECDLGAHDFGIGVRVREGYRRIVIRLVPGSLEHLERLGDVPDLPGEVCPAGVIDCPAAFKGKPAYSRQTFLMIL
jgi:nitroreductase